MKKVIGIIVVVVIVIVALLCLFNKPRYIISGTVTLSDGQEVDLDYLNEQIKVQYDTKTNEITLSYPLPLTISGES